MTSPEEVARGLSEAQRAQLRHLSADWRRFNKKSVFDLPAGLMAWRPTNGLGSIDLRLTAAGLAVRQVLGGDG